MRALCAIENSEFARNFATKVCSFLAVTLVSSTVFAQVAGKALAKVNAAPAVDELFASDHIFVRVRAGCSVATTPTGDLTFRTANGVGDVNLGRIMKTFGVDKIQLALKDPPKRADIAASVGLDRWYRVSIAPGSNALAVADTLQASWVGFQICEVDGVGGLADVPNDTSFTTQYSLDKTVANSSFRLAKEI